MTNDPELVGGVVSRVLAALAERKPCTACNGEQQPTRCQYCGPALDAKLEALASGEIPEHQTDKIDVPDDPSTCAHTMTDHGICVLCYELVRPRT